MGFTIRDDGEGLHSLQSNFYQEQLEVLLDGISGVTCVISGGVVGPQGSPNMTVTVSKAGVMSNGNLLAVAASASLAVAPADATNPRLDLVVITSAGTLAVRTGTPAAAATPPKPPNRTANDVVLAILYIPAGLTGITANHITDQRVLRNHVTLKKVTTPVAINTNATIQTLFTLTVPDGMLLAGEIIRVTLGGSYVSSVASTWTFTISFGGTTMFADVTVATTADTDRGAWRITFNLISQATSDQALNGEINFQTPGAKTAPASGVGDLAVVTSVTTPINGASAVNTDTGNRDLLVRVTHSVSNATVETLMEFATAELL